MKPSWFAVHVGACMIALLGGCASYPTAEEYQRATVPHRGGPPSTELDGRARFRGLFCSVVATAPGPDSPACESLLWRLADEPAPPAASSIESGATVRRRVFIVTGSLGDCRLAGLVPFEGALPQLAARAIDAQVLQVSGRSGASHNARQIAAALRAAALLPDEQIVLVGYSKGAVDILQFLVDEPELSTRVAAVVSVSGPIFGSPLAAASAHAYRTFLSGALSSLCDPGDGLLLESLLPEERRNWLATHQLPSHIRYYSIAGFTTRDHMSRALREPWQMLARTSRLNDGQVVALDAVIPGSTLLGYVNADHWDIAIAIERAFPHAAARPDPRVFPRAALLEALLMYVDLELARDSLVGSWSRRQAP